MPARLAVDAKLVGDGRAQHRVGQLRALAVSGAERLTGELVKGYPTLQESGIDLTFVNWRGVMAPPDLPASRRDDLIGYMSEMHETAAWKDALETNGWIDAFRTGDEYAQFLTDQNQRVETTLEEVGLL